MPGLQLIACSVAAAAVSAFLLRNHRRIRRAKTCMRVVRLFPRHGTQSRPHPLIFLAGSGQKADVWRGRMESLAAEGYECHAIDFSQTGCYFTSYGEQMNRLHDYCLNHLDGRPVLIGHSQGGMKAQHFLLAANGDAALPRECSVCAMVLMASPEPSFVRAILDINAHLISTTGIAKTLLAGALGMLYFDVAAFVFGGGPWRHELGMYKALFSEQTSRTTLTSAHGLTDARVAQHAEAEGAATGGLDLATWASAYLVDHDPAVFDLGMIPHVRSPAEALAANGCQVLHMVSADDRIVPRRQSQKVAAMWQVPELVISGQGHQCGDAGWERSVMGPLRSFLDALESPK